MVVVKAQIHIRVNVPGAGGRTHYGFDQIANVFARGDHHTWKDRRQLMNILLSFRNDLPLTPVYLQHYVNMMYTAANHSD